MARAVIWTKEIDDKVRNLIKSEGVVTFNMLREAAPSLSVSNLGQRVSRIAREMGYNLGKLYSKNHDTPLVITRFDTSGDIEDTKEWTEEDSQKLLEIVSSLSTTTLRALIEEFKVSSTTISNKLRKICKDNDIRVTGLDTDPKGGNKLDCSVRFQFSHVMVKGLIKGKEVVKRFKVVMLMPDGTKPVVVVRAETKAQAFSKAESMFKGARALRIKE